MTVQVKFFAYFREAFGDSDLAFDLPDGANVGAALDRLGDAPAGGPRSSTGRPSASVVLMINGAGLPPDSGLATVRPRAMSWRYSP